MNNKEEVKIIVLICKLMTMKKNYKTK